MTGLPLESPAERVAGPDIARVLVNERGQLLLRATQLDADQVGPGAQRTQTRVAGVLRESGLQRRERLDGRAPGEQVVCDPVRRLRCRAAGEHDGRSDELEVVVVRREVHARSTLNSPHAFRGDLRHHAGIDRHSREQVIALYDSLLAGWNADDASAFAAVFAEDGQVVGFDGSEVAGRARIEEQMARIFADHATGSYVGIIREVGALGPDAALLRAVSGVVPAVKDDIEPALNATQSLVAHRGPDGWQVVLYQNTPAKFHGRPQAVAELTTELRAALDADRRAGG